MIAENKKRDIRQKLTDSEVIFIILAACYDFSGNFDMAMGSASFDMIKKILIFHVKPRFPNSDCLTQKDLVLIV